MSDGHGRDTDDMRRTSDRSNERRQGDAGTMTQPEPAGQAPRDAPVQPAGQAPRDAPVQQQRETRTSPETVRTEPVESQRTSRQMENWPEMAQYRQRFDEIQAGFIEEPREAVKKAEQVVVEALDKMTSSMRERIQSMDRDLESGDTEKMRLAMKSLRDFMDSMGGRRAA